MVIDKGWMRWLVALAVFITATSLNILLQPQLEGRAPLLPYFPALVIVGLVCGFAPALAFLLASCAAILYFWIAPFGELLPINSVADLLLIALFFGAGSLVAAVSASAGSLMKKDRLSRRRLKLALGAGRMVTWDLDVEKNVVTTTGDAQAIFGRSWTSIDDLIRGMTPPDAEQLRQRFTEALAQGSRFSLTVPIQRADTGEVVWTQVDGDVVLNANGQATQVHGTVVDVTELAAAQAQLRIEAQRKDAFLATLAHELRNPMAPIRYAVATLLESRDDGAKLRASQIISRQSAHVSRLLDDLLDMSRITRNAVALQREVVDLRGIVKQALEAVDPFYVEKQHRVSLSMPPSPVLVDGDPTRLQQVLGNLLDNAAKYSPVPGEMLVILTAEDGQAQVVVVDHGIGIDAGHQPRVFELFSRVDDSSAAPAGLGIGLAVSLQLMRLHGGDLRVESAGLGHGSRFIVQLPLAASMPDHQPGDVAGPAAGGNVNARVLVVDDNRDGADSLAVLLRTTGLNAEVAYSGEEACARFEQFRPQVVLLDIGLPDVSGLDVAKRLRALSQDRFALIAVTGWGQQVDRDATSAAGFDAHLVKPVEFPALQRLIETMTSGGVAAAQRSSG